LIQLLTQEQLAHLLAHLPAKERMGACSLVHNSWRAAANLAMAEITCPSKGAGSLSTWLQANCGNVHVKSISVKPHPWRDNHSSSGGLLLPVHQLRSLQSLTLHDINWSPAAAPAAAAALPPAGAQRSSGSSLVGLRPLESRRRRRQGAAPAPTSSQFAPSNSLSSLTSLTRLDLEGKSVVLGGLSALTGLKELRCKLTRRHQGSLYGMPGFMQDDMQMVLHHMFYNHSTPAFDSAEAALVAALPHLGQSLTSLELEDDIGSQRVIAGVSTLTRLQRLLLPDTQASGFAGLPRTLTELRLSVRGPASTLVVPLETSAVLAQLSSMCVLTLEGFNGLDTAVFSAMSSLRELSLAMVTFAPAPGQLLFVSKLTALQSLTVNTSPIGQQDITAAEAAALTAPQQLTSLKIPGLVVSGKLQAPQYSSMFPVGRRLSSLPALQLGSSFLRDAAVVSRAADCCTALTSLMLEWISSSAAGQAADPWQLATGVGALTCFGSLASLTLNAPRERLLGFWSNLARLTDLRSLKVMSLQPDYSAALALTRCQRLQRLRLEGSDHAQDFAFECDIYVTSTTLSLSRGDKVSCAGARVCWGSCADCACWLAGWQRRRPTGSSAHHGCKCTWPMPCSACSWCVVCCRCCRCRQAELLTCGGSCHLLFSRWHSSSCSGRGKGRNMTGHGSLNNP
jgi:hypothetical protein